MFEGPRRLLLEHVAHKQNAWSFGTTVYHTLALPTVSLSLISVSNGTKSMPVLGSVCNDPHPFPRPPDLLTLVVLGPYH